MKSLSINNIVTIHQKEQAVEMKFSKEIPEGMLKSQLSSCEAATCSCCTPEFREHVEGFSIQQTENGTSVILTGDITPQQVHENVLSCAPKLMKKPDA